MIGWLIDFTGQVLLFCLVMNLIQGGLVGIVTLQWYLMRKLSDWVK